jgi:predicted metal-dependent HD superfamily phosphohydrolase
VTADGDGARFIGLWGRCVPAGTAPSGAEVYAELHRLYSASYRHFHNLGHIGDCVRWLDEVAPLLDDADAVELALWFHDAVYEVGSATNERRSAEMFLGLSATAGFAFRHRVCSLIMATRHARRVHGNDRCFMVDIDLSGFGAPWEEFMASGARLRAESSGLSDAQYHGGQTLFLQRLKRRPHVFATDYFRNRYERTAQDNLRRLLDQLAQKGFAPAGG